MAGLIVKTLCTELVLMALTCQLTLSLPITSIDGCIESFNDIVLPIDTNELSGAPSIEGLGRILHVPDNGDGVKFVPSKPARIKAKFDIITRGGLAEKLEFEFKQRPIEQLGIELCDTQAKYPFNFSKLVEAGFDTTRQTVIVVGGWLTLDHYSWFSRDLIDTWLSIQDLNVIVVTWNSANQGNFENAVANSPYVARQISILLYYLARMNNRGLSDDLGQEFLDKVHIIGHSCGAHIAGFVGKDLGGLIGRVSGLDPAGPYFDEFESEFRLNKGHAKLVDVYHSNAGKFDKKTTICSVIQDRTGLGDWFCSSLNIGVNADPLQPGAWFGINKPIGHLDIYLNNGHKQPGCYDKAHICDHQRAYHLIGDSLVNTHKMLELPSHLRVRPLAFRAQNYDSFKAGDSFRDNKACSWLTKDLRNGRRSGELDSCSIAIDFMKSPSDYRRELESSNGIDLTSGSESSRYYLETLSTNPILPMHHFVLKLSLGERQDGETLQPRWDDECRLDVEVSFSNPNYNISMKNIQIEIDELDGQSVLTLPFHHPRGLDLKLDKEFENFFENADDPNWIDQNMHELRGELFPSNLLINSSLVSLAERNLAGPTNFRTLEQGNKSARCELNFDYAIIEPIWTNSKRLYGEFKLTEEHHASWNDWLYVVRLDDWIISASSSVDRQHDSMRVSLSSGPIDLGLETIIIDEPQ